MVSGKAKVLKLSHVCLGLFSQKRKSSANRENSEYDAKWYNRQGVSWERVNENISSPKVGDTKPEQEYLLLLQEFPA